MVTKANDVVVAGRSSPTPTNRSHKIKESNFNMQGSGRCALLQCLLCFLVKLITVSYPTAHIRVKTVRSKRALESAKLFRPSWNLVSVSFSPLTGVIKVSVRMTSLIRAKIQKSPVKFPCWNDNVKVISMLNCSWRSWRFCSSSQDIPSCTTRTSSSSNFPACVVFPATRTGEPTRSQKYDILSRCCRQESRTHSLPVVAFSSAPRRLCAERR